MGGLRDKPVFLTFGRSEFNSNEVRDLARSVGGRVHFVGVQTKWAGVANSKFNISADEAARRMGFPVAVDAQIPDKSALGWQTWQSSGNADFAVIGRDGCVLYAGGKLADALSFATQQASRKTR